MSGSAVDMLALSKTAGLAREGGVAEALDRYEMSVDGMVKEYLTRFESTIREIAEAEMTDEFDGEKMTKIIQPLLISSMKLRDLNRSTLRELESVVDAESFEKLQRQFRRAGYPVVYRPNQVDHLKAVIEKSAWSKDVAEEFAAIVQGYDREWEAANISIMKGVDETQEALTKDFMAAVAQLSGEAGESPMATAMKERQAIEERYVERLKSLVPAAELATIEEGLPLAVQTQVHDLAMPDLAQQDSEDDEDE